LGCDFETDIKIVFWFLARRLYAAKNLFFCLLAFFYDPTHLFIGDRSPMQFLQHPPQPPSSLQTLLHTEGPSFHFASHGNPNNLIASSLPAFDLHYIHQDQTPDFDGHFPPFVLAFHPLVLRRLGLAREEKT
jgi:hypothetical protein